jgi:hypothetical protein
VLWALSTAWADEPPAPAPGGGDPSVEEVAAVEEVTVWGAAVVRARDAVERSIVDLGYDQVKDRGDRTVFRAPQAWKGKVVLTDEGTLRVRRTAPRFREMEAIPGTRFRPYPLCLIMPTACVAAGSWYVSDRRWGQVEDHVADATSAPLNALSEALADRAVATTVEGLPDRLEALWTDGTPLEPGPALATAAERRAALFVFWDTRTETEWGRQVREVVEAFVLGRVQASDEPYPLEEQALFQANRRSLDPFPFPAP